MQIRLVFVGICNLPLETKDIARWNTNQYITLIKSYDTVFMFYLRKEVNVPAIKVSPEVLREKARLIRSILDESKTNHQILWGQMSGAAGMLSSDLRSTHEYANNPWNSAFETFYENYYQLAVAMETAADAYERGDKSVQLSFTPTS